MEPENTNPAAEKSRACYREIPVLRTEHREGSVTRMVEAQTARIPSDVFLFLALGAMAASAVFQAQGNTRASHFVGMWPGPLLTMGVYNKLVKLLGPR
ncbi:MAG: hypothetical protein KA712_09060 [Myxococcales bacterium]|nr:hypothetical protein [Myxococcales bacterium]